MSIENEIRRLADKYANNLKARVDQRVQEMESDDNSHYLIYQVLGVTDEEIDRCLPEQRAIPLQIRGIILRGGRESLFFG